MEATFDQTKETKIYHFTEIEGFFIFFDFQFTSPIIFSKSVVNKPNSIKSFQRVYVLKSKEKGIMFLAKLISCFAIVSATSLNVSLISFSGAPKINIRSYTALGDSYATGVGAGQLITSECSHYSESYPLQLHYDQRLGPTTGRVFQNIACAGAVADTVVKSQIPRMKHPRIATLSIGGNDAHFFRVINACIYRFNGLRSGDCEQEILEAFSEMHSVVPGKLYNTYSAIVSKLGKSHSKLFITTYPRFFNAETDACNNATFAYWPGVNMLLSKSLRHDINRIVLLMRSNIVLAADRVNREYGKKIYVVDTDSRFNGHRFCEDGV
jgi:lysophospholipase L1-like esterase